MTLIGPQVVKECCKDRREFISPAQQHHLLMLPLNPTRFTYRTSWSPHCTMFIFLILCSFLPFTSTSWPISIPSSSLRLSVSPRQSWSLFVHNPTVISQYTEVIYSVIPPNGVKKSYHSPLMGTGHNVWYRAISGPGQCILLRENKINQILELAKYSFPAFHDLYNLDQDI